MAELLISPIRPDGIVENSRSAHDDNVILNEILPGSQNPTKGKRSSQGIANGKSKSNTAHLSKYFTLHNSLEGRVKCSIGTCNAVFKLTVPNLNKHYRTNHPKLDVEFQSRPKIELKKNEASSNEPPVSKKPRLTTATNPSNQTNDFQKQAINQYYKYLIDDIVPTTVSESVRFEELLSIFRPDFKVPSKKEFSIGLLMRESWVKKELMDILSRQKYLASTADCWITNNHCFLGMSVHWIEINTLIRRKVVLGVVELKGGKPPTGEVILRAINDCHKGIQSKVLATTSDNGLNCIASTSNNSSNVGTQVQNDIITNENQDSTKGPIFVSIQDSLNKVRQTPNLMNGVLSEGQELSKIRRCGVYNIHFLATKNTANFINRSVPPNPVFITFAKAMALLTSSQKRKASMSPQIKDLLNKKPTSITTWNSFLEFLKSLLQFLKDKNKFMELNEFIQTKCQSSTFNEEDVTVIDEYVKIMEPVARCLNVFMSKENAYMGTFLPNIFLMTIKLNGIREEGGLSQGNALLGAFLDDSGRRGIKAVFSHFFEDKDLFMAVALHPHFKLKAVMVMSEEMASEVFNRLSEELAALVSSGEKEAGNEMHSEDNFFSEILRQQTTFLKAGQRDIKKEMESAIDTWNETIINSSKRVTRDMFPEENREAWIELFIKYNTPLPSSAAVDNFFANTSGVLNANPSVTKYFEKLIFMKGNYNFLQNFESPI